MVSIAEVLTEEYFETGRRACWGLGREFNEPYMDRLRNYLVEEESKYQIFPKPERVFEALEETTLEEVKVVMPALLSKLFSWYKCASDADFLCSTSQMGEAIHICERISPQENHGSSAFYIPDLRQGNVVYILRRVCMR